MIKEITNEKYGQQLFQIHRKAFNKDNPILKFSSNIIDSNYSVYGYFNPSLVGYVTVSHSPQKQITSKTEKHIRSFAVLPEHQGKNIGSDLLAYVLSLYPHHNFALSVRPDNKEAMGLYKSQGFNSYDNKYMTLVRSGVIAEILQTGINEGSELLKCIGEIMPEKITPEMTNFYEERTVEHINRVRNNMLKLAEKYPQMKRQLEKRGELHDQSKYSEQEKIPYIWLTWWHKCKNEGHPLDYPEGVEEETRKATKHHITTNPHHPQCHNALDKMSTLDIMEMICDHLAMCQELGGTLHDWTKKETLKKNKFNNQQETFILEIVDVLE